MTTQQDARERAWREGEGYYIDAHAAFNAAWLKRGRYDEQRIAALVAALKKARAFLLAHEASLSYGVVDVVSDATRALAGRTEEVVS